MTRTRRRRLMLVPATMLVAACNRGEAASNDALGTDAALIARLQRDSLAVIAANRAQPAPSAKPSVTDGAAVCRPVSQPAQLATASLQQDADLQLQLAREAELAGDRRGMRDALRRAARLDPTNIAIAQRLARASDELQDATAAVDEYCRVLALHPSPADSTAVSERLRQLAAYPATAPTAIAQVAAAATPRGDRAVTRRSRSARNSAVTRAERAAPESTVTYASGGAVEKERQAERQVASQPVPPAANPTSQPTSVVRTPDNSVSQPASDSARTIPVNVPADSAPAATTVASTPAPEQPAPQPRARRSGGVSGRNVMTGAAVGAVLGGVVGRNARSAVIGAAAGGLMGAMARPSRIATGTFARSN